MAMIMVAIAWIYVVLLMSMTEQTIVAGVMTFLFYCVFPLSIILYVMGTPQRKRNRQAQEKSRQTQALSADQTEPNN
ncbi:preprotein translocase subunit SecG [Actimicrobium sp. GrIS 1.19]|nr:preprotein translocase subunit SecG [Actimicrobium sp. GrIS 1.19]